jgi:GNAT superfamily N-acetyltransferase
VTEILHNVSKASILEAMDANLSEYCLLYGRLPGAEAWDESSLRWFVTGVPDEAFNGVICAKLDPSEVDSAIERVVSEARRRGVPVRWQIGPTSRPKELESALLARGFTHAVDMAGMALEIHAMIGAPPVPGMTVEPIVDSSGLRQWIDAWGCESTELARQCWWRAFSALGLAPEAPWLYFIARWNGELAAAVKLHFAAGVVCVHHVSTVPAFRRRGIGTALVARALAEAQKRGYRVAVLTASALGFGSYRRLGFQTYCTVRRFRFEPERMSSLV